MPAPEALASGFADARGELDGTGVKFGKGEAGGGVANTFEGRGTGVAKPVGPGVAGVRPAAGVPSSQDANTSANRPASKKWLDLKGFTRPLYPPSRKALDVEPVKGCNGCELRQPC